MKKMKFLLLVMFGLLVLAGCEDGAKLRITNKTNHNLYGEIDDAEFTIAGKGVFQTNVDTDRKVPFFSDGRTKKTLKLGGETFRIYDSFNEVYVEQTRIVLTPGKTYTVFCSANSASVKVINLSDEKITELKWRRITQFTISEWFTVSFDPPLENEDYSFYHLAPQTEQNRFFYNFELKTESGETYTYGNDATGFALGLDEQHLIEFTGNEAD